MQQNTGRNTCSILVLWVSASYNPPLTPAKQLESPGRSQSPHQPAYETGTHTCRAQLTNFRSWLNVREVAVEGLQRVRKQQGGKGSRSESLWGGSSADQPGNQGQGELHLPSLLIPLTRLCVFIIRPFQDVLLPLQIKLSTCATEINYSHQAGSSQTLTGLEWGAK